MKVTIKQHNRQYLETIANQMGIDSKTEVINYLLLELRKMGYSFGTTLPALPQQYEPATAMSGLAFQPQSPQAIREYEQLAQEIDPVIERLAHLVDSF